MTDEATGVRHGRDQNETTGQITDGGAAGAGTEMRIGGLRPSELNES